MFYTQCIEIDVDYTTPIENGTIYNICKNLINNKKELVNIRIKYMAKFYDQFISSNIHYSVKLIQ
ncbi:hypothetical protein YYE_04941 [Plasmodium vinckei vinckei]|uniref:Uncharacterized protein n=1 Tax=Plasmodium vinckei vinckei TaxID=54757 RepID=A0A081I956_PLAVN|nr:hypothetical protein YYE_04941 [Plasmodium vinckei vinckei]